MTSPAVTAEALELCDAVATPTALVVINGDDVYEDLVGASLELQAIATEAGFAAGLAMGMDRFRGSSLSATDVAVLYTAAGEFTLDQQLGLAESVRHGLGLVVLHASNVLGTASASDSEPSGTAFDLVGSRYASHGPLPHESRFVVETDDEHPITAGLERIVVTHEHYHLQLADDRNRILAWRETPDSTEPLVYVRDHGSGRVCYIQLGHDMRIWDEPGIRTIVARAILWAARRDS